MLGDCTQSWFLQHSYEPRPTPTPTPKLYVLNESQLRPPLHRENKKTYCCFAGGMTEKESGTLCPAALQADRAGTGIPRP